MNGWGGIIVAGGSRSGAGGLAGTSSPCLLPIANRPLIEHVADALAAVGIDRLAAACDVGLADDLAAASQVPFAGVPAGSPESAAVATAMIRLRRRHVVAHVADRLVDMSAAAEAATAVEEGRYDAVEIGPGVIALGPRALDLLPDSSSLVGLPASLQRAGLRVRPATRRPEWVHAETGDSLLEANRLVLDRIPAKVPVGTVADSTLQGRVFVARGARIRRSVVRGPVAIGRGARISDAYIGPYSSIGPDVEVEGTELDHSVVLAGAVLSHVGWRLEGSVIGPGTRVVRSFGLPKALHLHIGPGARISVS